MKEILFNITVFMLCITASTTAILGGLFLAVIFGIFRGGFCVNQNDPPTGSTLAITAAYGVLCMALARSGRDPVGAWWWFAALMAVVGAGSFFLFTTNAGRTSRFCISSMQPPSIGDCDAAKDATLRRRAGG